jgi:hypothetical protein
MPNDRLAEERRRGYRFRLQLPIKIEAADSTWIDGETRDVSAGGFLLFTTDFLPAGIEIEYIISVPDFRSMKLRCAGKVLRSRRLENGGSETAVTMQACLSVDGDL